LSRQTITPPQKADHAPGPVRLALEMRAPWALGMALAAYPFLRKAPSGGGPVLEACAEKVRQLHAEQGRKASLGGVYAREIAQMVPDHVRVVVSLGAPFTGSPNTGLKKLLFLGPARSAWPNPFFGFY
jgi:hypothetical protein